jgi:flagellar basal-body rod protein FlgB
MEYEDVGMPKINGIVNLIEAGIRAETVHQKVNASNVANMQTQGYRRMDVRFNELLAKALESPGKADSSDIEPQIYQPKTGPVNSNDNDVNMETEVGEMIKNSLRYKTYVRLLGRVYRQIDMAMEVK